jgi:hypothetical protein
MHRLVLVVGILVVGLVAVHYKAAGYDMARLRSVWRAGSSSMAKWVAGWSFVAFLFALALIPLQLPSELIIALGLVSVMVHVGAITYQYDEGVGDDGH